MCFELFNSSPAATRLRPKTDAGKSSSETARCRGTEEESEKLSHFCGPFAQIWKVLYMRLQFTQFCSISFHTHNSSLEGAMELKFALFCSS